MGVSLPPVAYERIHGRQRASVRGLEDDLEGGYLSKHRRHTCNSGSLAVSRSEVKRPVHNNYEHRRRQGSVMWEHSAALHSSHILGDPLSPVGSGKQER
jgi:hypothetical protein